MIDVSGPGERPRPELNRSGLVAGIGLRAQTRIQDVMAFLDACLASAVARRSDLVALATLESKARHPALVAAAEQLGLPVFALPPPALLRGVPNPSDRVAGLVDIPSVAEAAALAFGPLVLEKQRGANLTCALSRYVPGRSSAASAASMLATSSAGP